MGFKIRKEYNLKIDIAEISEFIKCNSKGIYHIESNFENIKSIRYLMYLRKKGLDINKVIDKVNGMEDEKE